MPTCEKLDPDKIKAGLNTKRIGSEVIVFGSVTSTNDIAAQYARDPANDGLVILAEQQTAGRGRGENRWSAEPGENILCSILLIDEPIESELLSLTIAVAVAEAIGNDVKIKWPNDMVASGKKIAGILLESKQLPDNIAYVIGIGINCNQQKFGDELQSIATSIHLETGASCDRTNLIKRLLVSIEHWLDIARDDRQQPIDSWSSLSMQLGQRITVLFSGDSFTGTCTGIDPEKGLIVQLDSGALRFFPAAQTSIAN